MTPQQAAELKPGDAVRLIGSPTSRGTVFTVHRSNIVVQWASGAVVCYFLDSMQHIERVTEPTHDPA